MLFGDVQRCLRLPGRTILQGQADYAILGILFACGLRRAELCDLKVDRRPTQRRLGAYAALVGHPIFAPHDARRTCARIYYDANAPLKQIQFLRATTSSTPLPVYEKFGGEAVNKAATSAS